MFMTRRPAAQQHNNTLSSFTSSPAANILPHP
jgi:hypothetical protein